MAYTANVPQSSQQISQTQPLIQANFQALSSFGNGYAEMKLQLAAPTFAGTSDGFYTLAYAPTLTNELFVHRQAAVAGLAEVPFTASKMSNTAAASCESGWTYLPSGLLLKWGKVLIISDGLTNINVASLSGGPNFNATFMCTVTPALAVGTNPTFVVNLKSFTPTATTGNFDIICSGSTLANTFITYMVLGV